jgi:hypothetical protein
MIWAFTTPRRCQLGGASFDSGEYAGKPRLTSRHLELVTDAMTPASSRLLTFVPGHTNIGQSPRSRAIHESSSPPQSPRRCVSCPLPRRWIITRAPFSFLHRWRRVSTFLPHCGAHRHRGHFRSAGGSNHRAARRRLSNRDCAPHGRSRRFFLRPGRPPAVSPNVPPFLQPAPVAWQSMSEQLRRSTAEPPALV